MSERSVLCLHDLPRASPDASVPWNRLTIIAIPLEESRIQVGRLRPSNHPECDLRGESGARPRCPKLKWSVQQPSGHLPRGQNMLADEDFETLLAARPLWLHGVAQVQQGETFGPSFELQGAQGRRASSRFFFARMAALAVPQLSLNSCRSSVGRFPVASATLGPVKQETSCPNDLDNTMCEGFATRERNGGSHQRNVDPLLRVSERHGRRLGQTLAGMAGKRGCLAGRSVVHAFPSSSCSKETSVQAPQSERPDRKHFRSPDSLSVLRSRARHAGFRRRELHAQLGRTGCRLCRVQDIDWLGMFQELLLRYGSSAVDLVYGSGQLSPWPVPLLADQAAVPHGPVMAIRSTERTRNKLLCILLLFWTLSGFRFHSRQGDRGGLASNSRQSRSATNICLEFCSRSRNTNKKLVGCNAQRTHGLDGDVWLGTSPHLQKARVVRIGSKQTHGTAASGRPLGRQFLPRLVRPLM